MKHKSDAPGLVVALGSSGEDSDPGRPTPDGDPNALSDAANTDTVPLNLLSMPDDQEQMQPPGVGDVVNYQVTGKVVAIEGDMAKVERQSINGQDLPGQDDEDPSSQGSDAASDDDDEGQSLRNDAAGIGMLSAILIAFFLWLGPSAHAQSVGPFVVMPGTHTVPAPQAVSNNASGATIGSITLTNNNGTPEIESSGSQILLYSGGSVGFFASGGNGGLYDGNDGHANFGGRNNEIYFDSGDAGIWTQGENAGSELDDGSGNMTVESGLTVNGKLTVHGGTDPPYVLLDTNSEAAVKGEEEFEVPTNKLNGAALFWNVSRHALEVYIASEDKFYDINGNVLATNVTPTPFTPFQPVFQTITTQTNGVALTNGVSI